jgi:hypothetical protein
VRWVEVGVITHVLWMCMRKEREREICGLRLDMYGCCSAMYVRRVMGCCFVLGQCDVCMGMIDIRAIGVGDGVVG